MPGVDGVDGDDGMPIPGGVGPQGNTGAQGAQGVQGLTGPANMPGVDGVDGDDGMPIPGGVGPQGNPGAQGALGVTMAIPGDDGEDGLVVGLPGPQGNPGATGPTVYPSAGIANSTGSAWGTSYSSTNLLPISIGGTNSSNTPTAGGIGYGTGTALAYTAAGTTGQVLTVVGGIPSWASSSGGVTVSATAPSSPSNGQLWYDSTNGVMLVYYGSLWVEDYQSQYSTAPALPDMNGGTASTTSFTYSLNCGASA